jgi:hypothetical protein
VGPDFFEGLDVLGDQVRRFAVDQRQEEVVAVDIGVAATGANPNEIYSKPIA